MSTLTVDEALARLRTWTSEPSEDTRDALVAAALAFTGTTGGLTAMVDAADKYRSEQREMAYQRSGFGCDIDAETARQDLRESPEIVDLDGEHEFDPIGVAMLRASGCHIAAKVTRLDGRWVGFSSTRKAVQP
jgi:hypothetical protein